MSDRTQSAFVLSGIMFVLAAFVSLSVTLAFVAPQSQSLWIILSRAPGRFLVSSFHLAALYIPAVLCAAAALLLRPTFVPRHLAVLLLSTIPFFTAATAIRLVANADIGISPITAWLESSVGRFGAIIITSILTAIEAAAIVLVVRRLPGRQARGSSDSAARAGRRGSSSMTTGMRRIQALLDAPRDARRPAVNAGQAVGAAPTSLTDLPEPTPDSPSAEQTASRLGRPESDPFRDDAVFGAHAPHLARAPVTLIYRDGRFEEDAAPEDPVPADATPEETSREEAARDDTPAESARREAATYEDAALDDAPDPDEILFDEPDHGATVGDLDVLGEFETEDDEADRFEPDPNPLAFDDQDDDEPLSAIDDERPQVPTPRSKRYDVPIGGLLHEYADTQYWKIDEKTREAAEVLRVTLDEFGIQAEVTGIRKGPVITMFEILPAPGVKLSKITNLSDNIALRLAASSVRIVAPIPGKHAVGIEIPNRERAIVGFAELLKEESFQNPHGEIPIALGKDIPGDAQIVDLTRMPHVLIAGATGSGKSVCVNSIICSILYRKAPHEVKLILIDPKIVELKFYNDIPHLLTPVITDPKRAFQALQYCIYEMERRYSLLDALQVRDIASYNRKIKTRKLATEPLPYIVVVVDEFADLMATSGKELESTLARLAAMSRAVGIHLVLATQRPSTDVITGLIKANIPSRIAFMVASKVDSRIILDAMGADKLLGRGDMLFTSAWDPFPVRMQGAFLSEDEVERVVTFVKQLGEPEYIDDEIFVDDEDEEYIQGELEDPLMEKAIEIVQTAGKASASYLQRRLKVGYNRAARMVEEMERLGIVGPQQGSRPRDVIGSV